MSTDDVDALFDDEDDISDVADSLAGVSLAVRPTQSVPPSPTKNSLTASGNLHRTRSDSKVPTGELVEAKLSAKEKYLKFFALREENGEYIQDVKEMTRVPVILKTDLTKSPPYVSRFLCALCTNETAVASPSAHSTHTLCEQRYV
jgi:protein SSD1